MAKLYKGLEIYTHGKRPGVDPEFIVDVDTNLNLFEAQAYVPFFDRYTKINIDWVTDNETLMDLIEQTVDAKTQEENDYHDSGDYLEDRGFDEEAG